MAVLLSMILMSGTGISAIAEGMPEVESWETQEQQTEIPEEEEPAVQETDQGIDLYQDFTDEEGNVITTIHAWVPGDAFQAEDGQITMEAKLLDQESEAYIKGMTESKLEEGHYLGGYAFYEIRFLVDGVEANPEKAVTLTIEGSGLAAGDTDVVKAFRYDLADPEVEGDQDELLEIGQKSEVQAYLEETGDGSWIEDQEYWESEVADGVVQKIGFHTWTPGIYGCYTECCSAGKTFTQETGDGTVSVTVPEGAFLTNVENVAFQADGITEEQSSIIREQLEARAQEQGQEVLDFRVYDLSFAVNGEEVQPRLGTEVCFTPGEPAEGVNSGLFCLDEENQSLIWLDGNAEDGSLSAAIEQMGIIGYWTYGDITAPEEETEAEGSSDAVPEGNSPDEEIQEEDSQETETKDQDALDSDDSTKDQKEEQTEEKESAAEKTDAGKKDTGDPDSSAGKDTVQDQDGKKENSKKEETGEKDQVLAYEDDTVSIRVSGERALTAPLFRE